MTFFELGEGLLKMLADIHGVSVKPSDVEELRHRFATLPAHPDVEQGLTQLPHPLALLCARGERPRGGRTAEQRDELASS